MHPDINTRDAILKIRDRIRQAQSEWEGEEISVKSMGKCLNKVFKAVVNKLKINFLPWEKQDKKCYNSFQNP